MGVLQHTGGMSIDLSMSLTNRCSTLEQVFDRKLDNTLANVLVNTLDREVDGGDECTCSRIGQ